jgi:hypothetical protein
MPLRLSVPFAGRTLPVLYRGGQTTSELESVQTDLHLLPGLFELELASLVPGRHGGVVGWMYCSNEALWDADRRKMQRERRIG